MKLIEALCIFDDLFQTHHKRHVDFTFILA